MSESNSFSDLHIVCLAGGVGGAKLADGLAQVLPPGNLTVIVNTGDDFEHLGLTICPDLDTVMYTLAGVANVDTGWGRDGESWRTMTELSRLGGPDWFRLGDLDLATHLQRTTMLRTGQSLTAVTQHLCQQLQTGAAILPMSDQAAPTLIESNGVTLPFQTWFVKERWQPPVDQICLPQDVRTTPQVLQSLEEADLVLIAPSNPFVSIAPILQTYPIRAMLEDLPRAVVAVSPIVGGTAVKGPAAKMMQEMNMPVSAAAVAAYYGRLLDGFVYDEQDAGKMDEIEAATLCVNTMMRSAADRKELATTVLTFAQKLGGF